MQGNLTETIVPFEVAQPQDPRIARGEDTVGRFERPLERNADVVGLGSVEGRQGREH